ncbi:glycerate kinase [Patescibacteria group bacterium]|nr:glycerate kinase [Patescibacteria group bacterium]
MSKKTLKELRKDSEKIFYAGLKAADPFEAVKKFVYREGNLLKIGKNSYPLNDFKHIYIVGAGKASAPMGKAIEIILKNRLKKGFINVKYGYVQELEKTKINQAGHPIPDEAGVKGTREIVRLLQDSRKDDLVICLISGGGSALLPLPAEGIILKEKQQTTQLLLKCGASIEEINTVRKHLSRIKGGWLAKIAYPAQLISLILSDVIGDPLTAIASGPTVPDTTTYEDCWRIVKKYNLSDKLSSSVLNHLDKGRKGKIPETPKGGNPIFKRVKNIIVGSNSLAIKAARNQAKKLGYHTLILSSFIEGETREVARVHAAIAKEILTSGSPVPAPACILSGGETTVTIKGKGLGGRNQEFALASAIKIKGMENVIILSAGTDGSDGPTNAAGAIADGTTLLRAEKIGINAQEYLEDNNSYHFFQKLKDLFITGPTNTNVMDLHLLLVG